MQALPLLIMFAAILIYLFFYKMQKKVRITLSIIGIIIAYSLIFIGQFTYLYYLKEPAVYTGPILIKESVESGKVVELAEGAPIPSDPNMIILATGQVVENSKLIENAKKTKYAENFTPPQRPR